MAPKGTPRQIVTRLNAVINEGLKTPEIKAALDPLRGAAESQHAAGVRGVPEGPVAEWASMVKLAGAKRGMNDMRRRKFLGVLGGAAAWPLAAFARKRREECRPSECSAPARLSIAGTLGSLAFMQRMRELGWIEGRTVTHRVSLGTEGRRDERFAEIAAEFVRLKVDVIFAVGTREPSLAAKRATAVIPIVFPVGVADPVGQRHDRELGAAGRKRHWGCLNQAADLATKRLGFCARRFFRSSRAWRSSANAGRRPPRLFGNARVQDRGQHPRN